MILGVSLPRGLRCVTLRGRIIELRGMRHHETMTKHITISKALMLLVLLLVSCKSRFGEVSLDCKFSCGSGTEHRVPGVYRARCHNVAQSRRKAASLGEDGYRFEEWQPLGLSDLDATARRGFRGFRDCHKPDGGPARSPTDLSPKSRLVPANSARITGNPETIAGLVPINRMRSSP
jgi:hypothetical protein